MLLTALLPAAVQAANWTETVPSYLEGNWGITPEACHDTDARSLQFHNGGFRWTRNRDNHGLVRGEYQDNGGVVLFRITDQGDDHPDWRFQIHGDQMIRTHLAKPYTETYTRCR